MTSKGRGRGFKANTNNNVVGNRAVELKPKNQRPGGVVNIDSKRSSIEHEQIMNHYKHVNLSSPEASSYYHPPRQNSKFS